MLVRVRGRALGRYVIDIGRVSEVRKLNAWVILPKMSSTDIWIEISEEQGICVDHSGEMSRVLYHYRG